MRIALVTTLNKKLYDYYGHMFYDSFNWPFDTYVYHEGWHPEKFNKKIHHRNIYDTNPTLKDFLERLQDKQSEYIKVIEFTSRDVERHPAVVEILGVYDDLS